MKITIVVIRTLVGLMFLMASVTYFLDLVPQPELTGKPKIFTDGLTASGYIVPLVKALELLCGLAFLSGRFVPLALVLIFPIAINILLVNALLLPDGLVIAIPLFLGILFLTYVHREKYQPLLEAK